MSVVDQIAQSIARQEGYNVSGSIAQRNNNPGNLRTWGSNPTSGGFVVFSTPEEGWEALRRQVQLNINRGLTLEEFFGGKPGVYGGYAPAADSNQPNVYAANVSAWTGIPTNIPLLDYDGSSSGGEWDLETGDSAFTAWIQDAPIEQKAGMMIAAAAVLGLVWSRM